MKNVLITGKTGFIGSKLIGKSFEGRITDYKELLKQTKNVVGIVHLAAKSNRKRCEEDIKGCIDSNILGVLNVLEVALKRNIWVLFISSFQVKEIQLYGISKLFGEELCRLYSKKGLRIKIIRLPIVYGPNDRKDKIVTKFIEQLKNNIEPTIDNNKKFKFLYVSDAVKLIESEVNVLNCDKGRKFKLINLVEGIRKVLSEEKK